MMQPTKCHTKYVLVNLLMKMYWCSCMLFLSHAAGLMDMLCAHNNDILSSDSIVVITLAGEKYVVFLQELYQSNIG